MKVSVVIQGWVEVLCLMKAGPKLILPLAPAYGDKASGWLIKPVPALIFKVAVLNMWSKKSCLS